MQIIQRVRYRDIEKQIPFYKIKNLKKSFQGSAPAPFVGRVGYPCLNIGILSLPEHNEEAWLYDAPSYWAINNFQIPEIIGYRFSLVNSRAKSFVKDRNKIIQLSQEVGLSSRPVEVEVDLKHKPFFRFEPDEIVAPYGPRALIRQIKLTENPKIHQKVEKVFSDHDLKANESLIYLYKNKFDENFLSKALSVGALGLKTERKLVPTRFSITATDSILSQNNIEEIKKNKETDLLTFFDGYLGNYYLFLFFPRIWSYELFEIYLTDCNKSNFLKYTTDYESYNGRKYYAENCAGGYYSVRLASSEKLKEMKKQASVLTLRFITDEYMVPLGAWVTREAARKALRSRPLTFSSREEMIKSASLFIKKKLGIDISPILNKSLLLNEINSQMKILDF